MVKPAAISLRIRAAEANARARKVLQKFEEEDRSPAAAGAVAGHEGRHLTARDADRGHTETGNDERQRPPALAREMRFARTIPDEDPKAGRRLNPDARVVT